MKCKICQQDKPEKYFYAYKKRGKEYHKTTCAICVTSMKREKYKIDNKYRDKLKKQSLKYAHSEKGRIKRKLQQRIRSKTKKFKDYKYKWEHTTEKGKASLKRRRNKWLKTDSGKVYIKRKYARCKGKIDIKVDLTKVEWLEILAKYNNSCAYCGNKEKLGQDHIIPLSRGGNHTKDNVVPACKSCNSKKGIKIWKPRLL